MPKSFLLVPLAALGSWGRGEAMERSHFLSWLLQSWGCTCWCCWPPPTPLREGCLRLMGTRGLPEASNLLLWQGPNWCHLDALVSLGGIGESQARGKGCQFPWLLVNLILLVVVDSCSARGVMAFLGCLFLLGWELGSAGPVSFLLSSGDM